MIHVENLSKSYGNNEVLKDISFHIKKNKVCGLIGKNGSGKTTLIQSILNRVDYHGKIKVDSEDREIYFISDTPSLYNYLSGHEYVLFVQEVKGCPKPNENLINELFDLFGFSTLTKNSLIKDYSFGERHKTALIAGFLLNPRLMILDEPTTGLDSTSTIILKKLIQESFLNGMTLIITHHEIEFIKNVCNSLIILHEKKIVYNEQDLNNETRNLNNLYLNIIGNNLERRVQSMSQLISQTNRINS